MVLHVVVVPNSGLVLGVKDYVQAVGLNHLERPTSRAAIFLKKLSCFLSGNRSALVLQWSRSVYIPSAFCNFVYAKKITKQCQGFGSVYILNPLQKVESVASPIAL
jgi:hypothetical protein